MRVADLPQDQQENPELHFAAYLRDVQVTLSGFKLRVDSFGILPRRLEAIIGPNGAGKTTLCDLITGKTRCDSGEIYIGGARVSRLSEDEIARKSVGRKFQRPNLFENLTVSQNMELALPGIHSVLKDLFRRTSVKDKKDIKDRLDLVDLAAAESKLAGALSHGQKQRLELAMLVASGAKLLMVDEPAAGLDQEERGRIVTLLRQLSQDHSIIVIEHDLDFIRNLQADVTVMSNGSDVAFGTFTNVWSVPIVREIYQGEVVQRTRREAVPIASQTHGLTVDGVSVYHGSAQTLDDVSIRAVPGSVVCVLGRNGSGKTTLMRSIMGAQKSRAGSVRLSGETLDGSKSFERSRKGVSLVPQGRGIFPRLTVEENLQIGREAQPAEGAKIPRAVYEALLREFSWMSGNNLRKYAGLLSGGQQQQLAIASRLISRPKVLLLDEPTDGIDLPTVRNLVRLVRDLVEGTSPLLSSEYQVPSEQRISVCLVEQNLGFAQSVADSFYVLDRGRIVLEGDVAELTPKIIDRFLGQEPP